MDAHNPPEMDNQWPTKTPLDPKKVCQLLAPLGPRSVAFYADEGLPWVEVHYGDETIVPPTLVVPVGEKIQEALGLPVFFQALRPNSICFVIDAQPGSLTQKVNDPNLKAEEYGVPLTAVAKIYQHNDAPRAKSRG
jgi:hypothetical protein